MSLIMCEKWQDYLGNYLSTGRLNKDTNKNGSNRRRDQGKWHKPEGKTRVMVGGSKISLIKKQ